MHADVMDCRSKWIAAYSADHPINLGTILAGAAIGGAVGGAISGSGMGEGGSKLTLDDMKPFFEACMKAKGYDANPDNNPRGVRP